MGSGSPGQVGPHRGSSKRIYVCVTCYSHTHFMCYEQFRARLLRNAVGLDRVHDSLLSYRTLEKMSDDLRQSCAEKPVTSLDIG